MQIHDIADYAIEKMPDDIQLGEFKYMSSEYEFLSTRNETITTHDLKIRDGFGIRMLYHGAWGFAAFNKLDKLTVDNAIKAAYKIARSSTMRNPGIELTNDPAIVDTVHNKIKIDPFMVPVEEKLDYFKSAIQNSHISDVIKFANAQYVAQSDHMIFYNTQGSKIDQKITWNGGMITLIASGNNDTQVRKFPDDEFATRGWEYIQELNIPERIEPVASELVQLLYAPKLKPGKSTIILNPSQLGLQLHESCGHPTELDRALGYEAAYAGTSFLTPELLKQEFHYGNELVNINADATYPGAIGTFFYDHEGVAAKNTPLVKNGIFVGYLTSRETAGLIGLDESGGTARSDGYDKIPLIRMTNIILQPQKDGYSLDEMIEETKEGYYFHTNRSWSIDDIRLNFQFGTEVGYQIKNGEITGLVKNPTYTGITPEFWNSVSAVGKDLKVLGTPFCGKGEPGQTMYTGHGGPHTRFENIRVGVI